MANRIYITPEDDIHAVIDQVSSASEDDVEIIVPAGSRILQNIVDAYLLRDAALNQGKSATIVTNDVMGKIFAERAGMMVASPEPGEEAPYVTEAMARMADIVPQGAKSKSSGRSSGSSSSKTKTATKTKAKKKSSTKSKTSSSKKSGSSSGSSESSSFKDPNKNSFRRSSSWPEPRFLNLYRKAREKSNGFADLKNITQKRKSRLFPFKINTAALIVGSLVVALFLAGFVFGKLLPKADAIIYPIRETASFTVEVLVDSQASEPDVARGIVPGEVFTTQRSAEREFTATGFEDARSKARGTITIYNEYSSQPQTFIPSRFQSQDGKIFWTTKTIAVPGATISDGVTTAGTVNVEVEADQPGEEFNIGPSRFVMPALQGTDRYEKVYAVSQGSMSGGYIGETSVVTKEDIETAVNTLKSSLEPEFSAFRDSLPDNMIVWDEAYNVELSERSISHKAGDPAERFATKVGLTARAIAYSSQALNELLDQEITSRLAENKAILPKSKDVGFLKPPVVDYQKGTIFATLHVKVDIIEDIDASAFRGAILRKDKQEIRQILPNFAGIERVEVKFWPFWVKSVPKNEDRVGVTIFGL